MPTKSPTAHRVLFHRHIHAKWSKIARVWTIVCCVGALLSGCSTAVLSQYRPSVPSGPVLVSKIHASWTLLHPRVSPPSATGGVEAFDGRTNQLILYGGSPEYGTEMVDATWLWTGRAWASLHPTRHPDGVDGAVMAYDGDTRQLVLFGGEADYGQNTYNTTWLWTGSTWTEAHPRVSPPVRNFPAMAFDPKSHQLLLFGGENSTGDFNDTWTWTGSNWERLLPHQSPPRSSQQAAAYDPTVGGVVLFGGLVSTSTGLYPIGTWLWTGTDWVQLSPSSAPSPRSSVSVAWDPAAKVLVAFGGQSAASQPLSDTWVFERGEWRLLKVAPHPSARAAGATFAYDPATRELVLFGGFKSSGLPDFGDTWILRLQPLSR